jgi:pimeloyl-ACP methyl ester carboxylesterase
MQIECGDLSLHALVDGDESAPPVLMLHGITSSVRTWDVVLPALLPRYRVMRLDFRGHGKSDRADSYGLPVWLDDAIAACEAIGEPALVVGHSLGGVTAAALAQRRPDLVKAAVFEDPPLSMAPPSADNSLMDVFRLMRESIPRVQANKVPAPVLADILSNGPSATGPTMGELLLPETITAMAESMLEVDAAVLDPVLGPAAAEAPMVTTFDPDQRLTMPSLLLAADPSKPDCVCTAPAVDHFRRVNPDAEVVVVEGAGHLIHESKAHHDEFVARMVDFLSRHAN